MELKYIGFNRSYTGDTGDRATISDLNNICYFGEFGDDEAGLGIYVKFATK